MFSFLGKSEAKYEKLFFELSIKNLDGKELNFSQRKEILLSIKYVKKVISGKFILDQKFLNKNNIDIVIQGSDYKDRKFTNKVVTFARTKNISSTLIRKLAKKNK